MISGGPLMLHLQSGADHTAVMDCSADECFLSEEAGETPKDRGGHVRMHSRAGDGLHEQVAMRLEEVLVYLLLGVGHKRVVVFPR